MPVNEPSRSPRARTNLAIAAAIVGAVVVALAMGRRGETGPSPAPSASAPGVERPTTEATVALFDDGAPMAGRAVVFQGADGRVLATARSGADGKATGPMPSGGMITVAYGTSLRQLVTIAGVEPNDVTLVGEDENDEEAPGVTSAIASVHLPGAQRGAARYGIDLGVGATGLVDAGAPLRLPVMRRYLDPDGRFEVLGLAYDADGGAIAYSERRVTAADAGDTEVTLAPWRSDWREQRIELTHPEGYATVKADLALHRGEARFDHRLSAPVTGPVTSLAFAVAPGLGTTATYRVEAMAGAPSSGRLVLVRRAAAMPTTVRLDLAEGPRVAAPELATSVDRARPVLGWKTEGDAASAHALVLQLSWPETKEHVWTVLAPPGTRPGFRFPALPDELADWRPDARTPRPAVALASASAYGGYPDVKKKWIHLLGELPEEDGTIRLSVAGDLDF